MNWLWFGLAGLIIPLVVGYLVLRNRLRSLARRCRRRVLDRLDEENVLLIEPAANCLGLRSRGPGHLRGNGCWALTNDLIHFDFWVGGEIIEIPRTRITGMRVAGSFLGVSKSLPAVIVGFTDPGGAADETAWIFADHKTVVSELEDLLS